MNLFDHLSEDLTIMMLELDRHPDQDRVKRLLASLTKAHEEACRASQGLRMEAAAERQLRTLAA
jgi:hypothetical protein